MNDLIKQIFESDGQGVFSIDEHTTVTLRGLNVSGKLSGGKMLLTFNGVPPHITKTIWGPIRGGVDITAVEIDEQQVTAISSTGKRFAVVEIE